MKKMHLLVLRNPFFLIWVKEKNVYMKNRYSSENTHLISIMNENEFNWCWNVLILKAFFVKRLCSTIDFSTLQKTNFLAAFSFEWIPIPTAFVCESIPLSTYFELEWFPISTSFGLENCRSRPFLNMN